MEQTFYDIFPQWMGIDSFGTLVLATVCFIFFLFLYFAIGGAICPDAIKTHFVRGIITLLWPAWIVLLILAIPFGSLYEFSKTPEEREREVNEFIEEMKDE